MKKYLGACATVMLVMGLLDALWIGWLARSVYQQGLGHLMAQQVQPAAAVAFYLVYGVGLMVFVVAPEGASTTWNRTLRRGALFGFVAYAVYDLTNLATLKTWSLKLSLIDMAWGVCVSAVSSSIACALAMRLLRVV